MCAAGGNESKHTLAEASSLLRCAPRIKALQRAVGPQQFLRRLLGQLELRLRRRRLLSFPLSLLLLLLLVLRRRARSGHRPHRRDANHRDCRSERLRPCSASRAARPTALRAAAPAPGRARAPALRAAAAPSRKVVVPAVLEVDLAAFRRARECALEGALARVCGGRAASRRGCDGRRRGRRGSPGGGAAGAARGGGGRREALCEVGRDEGLGGGAWREQRLREKRRHQDKPVTGRRAAATAAAGARKGRRA